MIASEIMLLQQKVSQDSDQVAFEQLFELHYTTLRQFATSIVKSKEVAEEMVEDVFVAAWNGRAQMAEISNFRVYLYVAVRNRCLNYMNRNKAHQVVCLDNLDVTCAGLASGPEDIMIASEMLHAVNKAVNDLPPRCRMVYKLIKEDGLKYKDVAEILSISPRTVENQIAFAVKKLASVLRIDFHTTRKSSFSVFSK